MSVGEIVRIRYTRPPNRVDVFENRVVQRAPDVVVTLLEPTRLARPVEVDGEIVLDDGAPVVWFTFPGMWHDIGRFHRSDGRFTGLYANVLTPVRHLETCAWETTDLFLDVWLGADAAPRLLDADELERARASGALDRALADRAQREADRLLAAAHDGSWPPRCVAEWTLDRARATLGTRGSAPV